MKKNIKAEILQQLQEALAFKINDSRQSISSAKESRNNDTKSSAGDKYETGRAMMQMEIDNNEIQLEKALLQQQELSKIDPYRKCGQVESGCLVVTNHENYFISIAMGKVMVDGQTIYAISLASPVGMLLKNKTSGQRVEFHGRELIIQELF